MKRLFAAILALLAVCSLAAAPKGNTQFGKCRALSDARIGKLFANVVVEGSGEFKQKLFSALAEQYTMNDFSEPVYFEVTEYGRTGLLSGFSESETVYFILFPPATTWRVFDPAKGIEKISVERPDNKEMPIRDLSGWIFIFSTSAKKPGYTFEKYTCAN